jgi:hypothetical protein
MRTARTCCAIPLLLAAAAAVSRAASDLALAAAATQSLMQIVLVVAGCCMSLLPSLLGGFAGAGGSLGQQAATATAWVGSKGAVSGLAIPQGRATSLPSAIPHDG